MSDLWCEVRLPIGKGSWPRITPELVHACHNSDMRNTGAEISQGPALAEDWSPEQRVLLTLAVRDYDDDYDAAAFAEGIDRQIAVVREWWSTPGPGPTFRQVPPPVLKTRDDVEDFLRAQQVRDMHGQALVVFVTGHGIKGRSDTHFLRLPNSVESRPLSTAMRTSEIVSAALDSHVDNVLVIINTCFAGSVNAEIASLYKDIPPSRRKQCNLDVLATCSHDTKIKVLQFPYLLEQAYKRLRRNAGITTPYLSVADFMAEYARGLRDEEKRQFKIRYALDGGVSEPTPCLPNPGYVHVPEALAAVRQDGVPAQEYWLDRATGRPQEQDHGWYFRGRADLNLAIASFLGHDRPRGVMVVTGCAGSGKSAVLARAVMLSDRRFRAEPLYKTAQESAAPETFPPENAVTAAVHARHLDAGQVATDLLRALGAVPAPVPPAADRVEVWSQQLLQHVRGCAHTVTVVLDGLDEAREQARIVGDILTPLAPFCEPRMPGQRHDGTPVGSVPAVRLLIGVRSSRPNTDSAGAAPDPEPGLLSELRKTFSAVSVLRTDTERSESDIAAYVDALISDVVDEDVVKDVVPLVAALVWPSFIDARLAGDQLRRSGDPLALAHSPEWQGMLRLGIRGLLQRDLALVEQDGLPSDVALALLQASAFAKGQGVPWGEIWPTIAGVFLAPKSLESDEWDTMIERLLNGRLSGYLAHSVEDNRRVYRPAHEELGEVLLGAGASLLSAGGHGV
ncbi:AAA family ATPase [Streptomyces sp. NPDC005925]|uniref:AAA family ATPase n=1 Tax=Streptomyces sp. NPDC005925 TaxID=3157172 RepID=UPI0034079954